MDVRSGNQARVSGRPGGPGATGHCPQLSAPEETAQAIAAFAGTLR